MIRGQYSEINPNTIDNGYDGYNLFEKIETKFILKDGDNLCCPVCGCDNVHLGGTRTLQGHQAAIVTGDGTAVCASDRHKDYRGSAVELVMHCESGCEFLWRLEFRKGTTFFGMYSRDYDMLTERPSELWRD